MWKFYFVGVAGLGTVLPLINYGSLAIALEPVPITNQPIVYDFTIDVTEGSLAGMSFDGSFCYDAAVLAKVGTETIGVDEGLMTSIFFFGQPFTQVDDSDYPEFPQLTVVDGEIEQLDFWIEEGDRLVWWDLPGWNVTLTPTDAGTACPVEVTDASTIDTTPSEDISPTLSPGERPPSPPASR